MGEGAKESTTNALLEIPMSGVLGIVREFCAQTRADQMALLRILMEHIYSVQPNVLQEHNSQELVAVSFASNDRGTVGGILLFPDTPMELISELCSGWREVDFKKF